MPIIALTVLIHTLTIIACSPTPKQQEYITIGVLLPLTGEDSDEGLRALNGLQLAREEINNAGGILGKMLDIFVLNDRGDEEYVVQQYAVLKEIGVAAIIGSSYSNVTMKLAQASEKDGIPVISPTASDPEITRGRDNVFRAIFIDDYQAEAMAIFAYNSLSARTAVLLSNDNADSYRLATRVFGESFRNLGGQVIAVEPFGSADEFAGILRRHAANPPDIIYCPESFLPAVALINTAHELGFTDTALLGSDAWDGVLAYIINGDAMKNVFYSAPFSFDDQDESVMIFVRNYFRKFSQIPLSGSATAYTCVYILAEAIKKAGTTNPVDVISAIKANELDVITGSIRFDENNNPRTNVYIIHLGSGEYSTYEKLSF